MKTKLIICFACICTILAGCSSPSRKQLAPGNSEYTAIGSRLEIRNMDERLTPLDNMDALSADGLYYASWTIGEAQPYENSDGDTVDLYDAQLYLLLGEFPDSDSALEHMNAWLEAGKSSYEILEEETITCSGQSYTLLTYNYASEDNPYHRGVSAFGAFYDNAVCIELGCQEDFSEDLSAILMDFLESCSYKAD